MTKNLLCLFFALFVFNFHQSKNKIEKYEFFCDTLAPANVAVTNISHTEATVSWANDPNTSNYVVEYRPVGNFAWISPLIPTGQNFVSLSGLMPCTAYEVRVAKICNNVSGTWSPILIFNTKLNYCTSEAANSIIMHTSNVTVTPSGATPMISNSAASLYTDYRSDASRKVYLIWDSVNNEISVTKSGAVNPNAAFVTVWIDFNANGVFETSEIILNSTGASSNISNGQFAVPSLASVGGNIACSVTMRVVFSNTAVANGCGTFGYGEVEDYDVYLTGSSELSVNDLHHPKEITVYPNPVSDILFIQGILSEEHYKIYNSAGQLVSEGTSQNKTVNVQHFTKGVYFIQFNGKDNLVRLKFIKK